MTELYLSPDRPVLSVIVPMHDAREKMQLCIESLDRLEAWTDRGDRGFEIIIVDDASTDGTQEVLRDLVQDREAWRLISLATNSGSPSKPRNTGLAQARGKYVFFLDGDDELDITGVDRAIELAEDESLDVVRGPVMVNYVGRRRVLLDRISLPEDAEGTETLEAMVEGQSLNCSALWRTDYLAAIGARFDEDVRMGEDLVFTSYAMTRTGAIGYVDQPLFHYVRQPGGGASSMHTFTGRELRELVQSWQAVEDCFARVGLSFLALRGNRTINYALRQVIRYLRRDAVTEGDLAEFADFFKRNWQTIQGIDFPNPHVAALVSTLAQSGSATEHLSALKPRLLIAGHDLKFILPALPHLRAIYEVRIDEWPSERRFNEGQSKAAVRWADYIWVEWLTSASVWYANRVRSDQDLVVRFHRYELGRSYGDVIPVDKISAFVAIAPHCFEDLVERFEIPRNQVRYIPNFYKVDAYERADPADTERLFRLAMIGSVPKRKGLLKALELLAELRRGDSRYELHIMGKTASDIPWIAGDPFEEAYFSSCDAFMADHGLLDAVHYHGWIDTTKVAKDYGFVLSMSEHEGSHVGPGEAFCAGNVAAFLPWRGVEYIYPDWAVCQSVLEMAKYVRSMQDLSVFNERAELARKHMHDAFDISHFVSRVDTLFRSFA